MPLHERIANIHVHTTASDGTMGHAELASLAAQCGVDCLLVADHNAQALDQQGWYGRTLLLVGEEVHAPNHPHHYLVFGVGEGMASHALAADGVGADPQRVIDAVRARGGIGFIAHPYERSGAYAREPVINWEAWEAEGYTGLEIWNYMSEFKSYLVDAPRSLLYAYWPRLVIRGAYPETLAKWDELMASRPVYALAGTDAHGVEYRMGPLRKRVFDYPHLLRALNTHLLLPELWSRDVSRDARLVVQALATGRAFMAYDALAPGWGFRFTAEGPDGLAQMGDQLLATGKLRMIARAPAKAHLRLIHNGFPVAEARGTTLEYVTRAPGAYRVEAYRPYLGRERAWLYSNPIFVRTTRRHVA